MHLVGWFVWMYTDYWAHRLKPSHPQRELWSCEEYHSPTSLPFPLPPSWFISPLLVAILMISVALGGGSMCLHTGQTVQQHRPYLETPDHIWRHQTNVWCNYKCTWKSIKWRQIDRNDVLIVHRTFAIVCQWKKCKVGGSWSNTVLASS